MDRADQMGGDFLENGEEVRRSSSKESYDFFQMFLIVTKRGRKKSA